MDQSDRNLYRFKQGVVYCSPRPDMKPVTADGILDWDNVKVCLIVAPK